jgi:hypothetical protein
MEEDAFLGLGWQATLGRTVTDGAWPTKEREKKSERAKVGLCGLQACDRYWKMVRLLDLNVVVLRRVQLAQHGEGVGVDLDRMASVAATRAGGRDFTAGACAETAGQRICQVDRRTGHRGRVQCCRTPTCKARQ